MNCPHCHVEIGGYVQVGTEAYGRVSRGQCPSCGRGMPAGYTVDFLASSGRLVSEEKAFQETLRRGAEFRDTMALGGAPDNYKRVRVHTFFGAIGLCPLLYCCLTMWGERTDGAVVFELGPFLFSVVVSILFWIVPVRVTHWHYLKYVKRQYDAKAAVANDNIKLAAAVVSWLLFFFGAFLWFMILG